MKKLSKKNIILIIIILVLVIFLGGTLAYFGWSTTGGGISSTIDVTTSGSNNNYCSKASDNEKLLIPTSTREKGRIITITAKQESSTNAFISWTLTINKINADETTTSGLKHESFKYELVNSTTGISYGSGNFSEVTDGSTITFSTIEETIDYGREYTFTLYLWIDGTIGINPSDMADQPYDFDISCTITGTDNKVYPPTLAGKITKLYDDSEKTLVTNEHDETPVNVDQYSTITYNYATSVSLMNDRLGGETTSLNGGNIRYYGASPNNYIYFNCDDYSNQTSDTCELWRIIGVFDEKVKIMRNESIGELAWNYIYNTDPSSTTYSNDWDTSSLNTLLNGAYLNNQNAVYYSYSKEDSIMIEANLNFNTDNTGIKDSTKNLISDSIYFLGKTSSGLYPDENYKLERLSNTDGSSSTVTEKIALIYSSDYAYAADLNNCNTFLIHYDDSSCTSTNWMTMYSSNLWLIEGNSNQGYAGVIYTNIYGRSKVYYPRRVFPTLYLNADVNVSEGIGTIDNPYKIVVGS